MIQDIGTGRFHNEYRPVQPEQDSVVLFYRDRDIFINLSREGAEFLSYGEVINQFPILFGTETYLFSVDGRSYYLFRDAAIDQEELEVFAGFTWEKIEVLRTVSSRVAAFAGVTGFQLWGWYCSRRFCPRCGQKMEHHKVERMMRCPACNQNEYPKICPAVIVGVTNQDRLLLTKYAGRNHKRYALIAGFAEIGETIEETVSREVMEEVGLKIKNIRYYKSQPWSFSDTLLMGFFAELDGAEEISLDENELSEGKWCMRDEIPEDDGISLTREMMRVFKEGKA